jgi:predicted ABC-type ATPase
VRACRARVATRVTLGGHAVPAEDLERRYGRSLANLVAVLPELDRAYLLDNGGDRPRLVLTMHDGKVRHLSRRMPRWARQLGLPQVVRG